MRNDVSNIQLKERRKVSYAECALISVVLVVATKVCALPSVLVGIAGNKAVWVVLILAAIECGILVFSVKTAKCGGLTELPLKKGFRIPLLLLFAIFFTLKLAAFTREIAAYFALSLFENVPVLPISILLLLACALLAGKGYMAIGRLTEVFVWLFTFVFLFVLIFTRTEGDLFNALGMFNPDLRGMGEGVLKGMAWFGDGAILSFLDLRGDERFSPHAQGITPSPDRTKAKRKIAFSALLASVLLVVLFYAVFISVYGDAAKMTDYAFIKLSAFKANADELGSADWPVIILWSVLSCLYLALLFLSGDACLRGLFPKEEKKQALSFGVLGAAAVVIATFSLDEEADYVNFMTKILNVVTFVAAAAAIATGVYALRSENEKRGSENEEKN